jgi:hypothetical protein
MKSFRIWGVMFVYSLTVIGCRNKVDENERYRYVIMQDIDNNASTTDSIIDIQQFTAPSDSDAYSTCIGDMFDLMLKDRCKANIDVDYALIDSAGVDVKEKLPEKYKNGVLLSYAKLYQRKKAEVDYAKQKTERQLRLLDSLRK